LLATIGWGIATALLIQIYPESNRVLATLSLSYVVLYIVVSLYRTIYPLEPETT
jgi:ABC-type uncharacterized transport system permease subunit